MKLDQLQERCAASDPDGKPRHREFFLAETPKHSFAMLSGAPGQGDVEKLSEGSPFGGMDLTPDDYTAYLEYSCCRSLPNISRPAASGNRAGFHPQAVYEAHGRHVGKAANFDHQMKLFDPQRYQRDKMIGMVFAAHFPEPPKSSSSSFGGNAEPDRWEVPEDPADAPEMTAVMALAKEAMGVSKFIGEHLGGRRKRAVSIEVFAPIETQSVFLSGSGEIVRLVDADAEIFEAVTMTPEGQIVLGDYRGEALAWAYGGPDGSTRIDLSGIGVVGVGAEPSARVRRLLASGVPEYAVRNRVNFDGSSGYVHAVQPLEEASKGDPELTVYLDTGGVRTVLSSDSRITLAKNST